MKHKLPSRGEFPRWLAATAVLCVTAVLLGGRWFYRLQVRSFQDRVASELTAVGTLKGKQIAEWKQERLSDGRIAMEELWISAGVPDPRTIHTKATTDAVRRWFRAFCAAGQYSDIVIVDINGIPSFSLRGDSTHEESHLVPLILQARDERRPFLSDLHWHPGNAFPSLDLVVPIGVTGGAARHAPSALVFLIDVEHAFYPLILSWPVPSRTAETILVERDGNEVLFLNELRHQKNTGMRLRYPLTMTDNPAVRAALGETGIVRGSDYRSVDVLAYVQPIADSPWFIESKVDAEEVFASIREEALVAATIVLLLVLSVVGMISYWWKATQHRNAEALLRAETQARESEERLRTVVNSMDDIVYTLDRDHRHTGVFGRWIERSGVTPGYFLGKTARDLFGAEGAAVHESMNERALRGESVVYEWSMAGPDSTTYLQTSVSPLRDPAGTVVGIVGVGRDITERKRVEEALRESETRFRAMFESSRDAIHVSSNGIHVSCNAAFLRMFGFESNEALAGASVLEHIAPSHRDQIRRFVRQRGAGEAIPTTYETRGRKTDGTEFDMEVSASVYELGGTRYSLTTLRDVTERNLAREKLDDTLELNEKMIQSSAIGIFACRSDGPCVIANPAVARISGATVEQMLRLNFRELKSWKENGLLEKVDAALAMGREERAEVHLTSTFGRDIWLNYIVTPFRSMGQPHFLMMVEDISDRKRAERAVAARQERAHLQQHAVVTVAMHEKVVQGDVEASSRVVTELAAETLGVERVSVWLLADDWTELRCLSLYERSTKAHSGGPILRMSDYPNYFRILTLGHTIDAPDARTDPRTREFTDGYLLPLGIVSMLDAPIRVEGRLVGILCHEHVGDRRVWEPDELIFASELADQMAFALANARQRKSERELVRLAQRQAILVNLLQMNVDSVQQFLDLALEQAIAITESAIGYIYHYSEERKEFTLNSWSKEVMDSCRVAEQQTIYRLDLTGIWGEAVRQRKEIIVNDFDAAHPLKKGYPEGHVPLRRFLTIPLFRDGAIVAVVGVANKDEDYDQSDVMQLQLLMNAVWGKVETIRAEEALRQTFQRLDLATQAAHLGIWDWDIVRDVLVWDKTMYELYGTTKDAFTGAYAAWLNGVHPDDRVACDGAIQRALSGEQEYNIEFRVVWPDGSEHMLRAHGQVTRDRTGAPVRMTGVNDDITDRKRSEEALRRSEYFLQKSQSVAKIGSYRLDIRAHTWMGSQALDDILGIGDSYVKSIEGWVGTLHPDDREGMLTYLTQHVIAGRNRFDREYRIVRHCDGEVRWVHGYGELECDESGAPLRLIGTIQDVSDRKQAEELLRKYTEELQRSNTELEQFAYIASHDLQEPLRMVSGFTQLLAQRYGDTLDENAKKYIHFAVDGATRMQGLIKSLLTYSRVARDQTPLEPVDSAAAVREALLNLSRSIEESHSRVSVGSLPTVRGNGTQLTQVFQNLIGNAIKFCKAESPLVTISADEDDGFWRFAVTDNGIGIDSEHFDRIFLIFQRLHGRKEYAGTGIGLAICRKIVERYGGRIWVTSQPGAGSTFYFTLPQGESRGSDR